MSTCARTGGPGCDPGLFLLARWVLLATLWPTLAVAQPTPHAEDVCPLYGWPGESRTHVPHAPIAATELRPGLIDVSGAALVRNARQWIEIGRPAAALAALDSIEGTPAGGVYRLVALSGLERWGDAARIANAVASASPSSCSALIDRWSGHAYVEIGDPVRGDEAFERLARALPDVRGYVALWQLEAVAAVGDLPRGRRAWAEVEGTGLPDGALERALIALTRLYESAGEHARAADVHARLAERTRGAVRGRHLLAAATAADLAGDRSAADRLRRVVLEEHPEVAAPLVRDAAMRERLVITPIEVARTLIAAGAFREGLRTATGILEDVTEEALLREALLLRARAHAALGDRTAAEADYARFLSRWPDADGAADAQYRRARLALSAGDGAAARRRLENFLARFPGDERRAAARYLIADSYQDDRLEDPEYSGLAIASFDRVVTEYPRSFYADRAYMRAAHLSFALGRYEEAFARYDRYRGQQSRREARYWLARTSRLLGDVDRAEALFTDLAAGNDYYALLARARLAGRSWLQVLADPVSSPEAVAAPARLEPPSDPAWTRATLLLSLGERRLARDELARGLARVGSDPERLAVWGESLLAWGFPDLAIRTGVRLGEHGLGERFAFPRGFEEAIGVEARSHLVDPSLMLALIRQESLFEPEVVSPAGAIGLMQIMPATGAEIAAAMAWEDYRQELLLDPAASLHFGALYLAQQRARFDGFWPAVLAAYNGGPHNVARWWTFPERELDPELWIDRLPFRETRDYVKRVLAHYAIYERLADEAGDR